MPKGVYPHVMTPARMEQLKRFVAAGRRPEVRARAKASLKANAASEEWRQMVSKVTKAAMHRPEVRAKHLKGLERWLQTHIPWENSNSNGKPPTGIVKQMAEILEPQGFIREYPIKTKGHGTGLKAATCYKVDFGHPQTKVAIELDGPFHQGRGQRLQDAKKDTVLKALGWSVFRIQHQ